MPATCMPSPCTHPHISARSSSSSTPACPACPFVLAQRAPPIKQDWRHASHDSAMHPLPYAVESLHIPFSHTRTQPLPSSHTTSYSANPPSLKKSPGGNTTTPKKTRSRALSNNSVKAPASSPSPPSSASCSGPASQSSYLAFSSSRASLTTAPNPPLAPVVVPQACVPSPCEAPSETLALLPVPLQRRPWPRRSRVGCSFLVIMMWTTISRVC